MKHRLFGINEVFFKKIVKVFLLPSVLLITGVAILYIFQVNTLINKQKNHFVEQFHTSIQNSIDNKKSEIEKTLDNVETNLIGIQSAIQNYYSNSSRSANNITFQFEKNSRGFWYKPENLKGSDVVFMPQATPSESDFIDAYNLEKIDAFVMPLVDRSSITVAGWMNMENYLVRYYPNFDMKNILEPDMDIKAFNFYYEADPIHNPKKQNIWSSPYLDPAMKGWMVSHVAPIWSKDQFLGVFGIDININEILNTLPKIYNFHEIKTFVTNQKGDVLSMNSELEHYFDLIKLNEYKEGKSLSNEVTQPDSRNLLNTSDKHLNDHIKKLFESDKFQYIDHKNKKYFIYKSKIKNTDWLLFYMVDESDLLNKLNEIESENFKITLYALLIFILLFIGIIFNLKRDLKESINQISKPIEELSNATKNIQNLKLSDNENILEIANLYKNFKNMALEINEHHQELENKVKERTQELNEKIKTIEELQEKLIDQNIHDHLTNLFNRRYADDVLRRESQKSLIESTSLSIVIIDIDFFKKVNDNYGHQVGDAVLIRLGSIIKSHIKSRDVPARYGGEEFLIILPNCDKNEAYTIVESIQKNYTKEITESMHLSVGMTLSAGIASMPDDSLNIEEVIKYADNALYQSKNSGRNCINIYNKKSL